MQRRAILRRLAASAPAFATGGCLGRRPADVVGPGPSTGTASPNETPTRTPAAVDGTPAAATRTPTEGTPRHVSLAGREDGPLRTSLGVAATATVVEPLVTDAHTAQVGVTLENRGERDRTFTYEALECDLNVLEGERLDGDGRLLLVPAGLNRTSAADACWRARVANVSCGIPVTTHGVDLPGGGRVTWTFARWAAPRGPCMPPGRYRSRRGFDDGAAAMRVTLRLTAADS